MGHLMTMYALGELGLDPLKDVKHLDMDCDTGLAAMKEGKLYAQLFHAEWKNEVEKAGLKIVADMRTLPLAKKIVNAVAFAEEGWVKANRGTVLAFVKSIYEAMGFVKENREETVQITSKYNPGFKDLDALRSAVTLRDF